MLSEAEQKVMQTWDVYMDAWTLCINTLAGNQIKDFKELLMRV